MGAYTPTNTPQPCPGVSSSWAVKGQALPPTPDSFLCDCMWKTLSCVPSSGLNGSDYGDLFGNICGASANACKGIAADTKTGTYGAFGMCNATQQLGYALDTYYRNAGSKNSNNKQAACDWKGQAVVVEADDKDLGTKCREALASASVSAPSPSGTSESAGVRRAEFPPEGETRIVVIVVLSLAWAACVGIAATLL